MPPAVTSSRCSGAVQGVEPSVVQHGHVLTGGKLAVMDELTGVTAIWPGDYHDGAVDGSARQGARYLRFCVDESTER